MNKLIIGSICMIAAGQAIAQGPGGYAPVPWPHLREADVLWSKRVWRVIDMREKQNQPMSWPGNPLNKIFYNAILSEQLIPYKNDSLSSRYRPGEYLNLFAQRIPLKQLINPNADPDDPSNIRFDTIDNKLRFDDVKKFKVMEDWIFDKKESRLYVRIIAIAPLVTPSIEGVEMGEQEWGWLKYQKRPGDADIMDVRSVLVNQQIFNRQNDAARISYDDWFEQRLFNSYIVKDANAHDLYIRNQPGFRDNGVASLLEAERMKNELSQWEEDAWEQ